MTILFVEDNEDHAELVMRSLEDHRVANRIHHLSDGEAALDYLLRRGQYADPESSPRPHLVLLDLRLPKIDGLEVLQEIRSHKELERLPVVILTTSYTEIDVSKAYAHHANSYLVKPLDFEKFSRLMKDLGFYWLNWNHYPWSEAG
jgi:CheY-like chemotaxis protein